MSYLNFPNFYLSENQIDYKGQLAIIKMSDPQVFVRFDYDNSYFASFEDWVSKIAVVEWFSGKPSEYDQHKILVDCWNFLAEHERWEDNFHETTF